MFMIIIDCFNVLLSSANAISVVQGCLHNYIKNDPPPTDLQSMVSWAACKYIYF